MLHNIKFHLIQFVKEQIVYRIPLYKPNSNTILFVNLEGIGDYILFRNFLPYLKKSNLFRGKHSVFIGNSNLKDFVERFDANLFDEYIWVNFTQLGQMTLWQRFLYLKRNVRKFSAATLVLSTHSRLDIEDLFVHSSGAIYKIAPEGDETRLGVARKKRSDKLFHKLIPCPPSSVFQFERNKSFFQQLTNQIIPIQRTSIEGISCKKQEHLISLYPGASSPYRRWAPKHFANLVLLIYQYYPHFSFQILGASWEIQTGLNILKNLPKDFPIQSLCGQTRLDELVEKIAESRLLISNETSGPHFAAALDIPCVCISNGNHFKRFHPYPPAMIDKIFTVYPTDDFYDERNFDYLAEKYRRWEDSSKLSDINTILPEHVFSFVKKLLSMTA